MLRAGRQEGCSKVFGEDTISVKFDSLKLLYQRNVWPR